MVPYKVKRDFADFINLRMLRRGGILDYLGGSSVMARVLIRRRQEGQSQKERLEDATPLALKMEEEAISQRLCMASQKLEKAKGMILQSFQKEHSSADTLDHFRLLTSKP